MTTEITSTPSSEAAPKNVLKMDYDGSLIKEPFGYKYFRNEYRPLGVILSFRGKMEVTDHLIDLEDSLTKDFIYSDDAINFCWEIPNLNNLGAVFFQRLFCTYVSLLLRQFENQPIKISGDDILLVSENSEETKKVSVSITKTHANNLTVGHLGINICAGSKAPEFAGNIESLSNTERLKNFVKLVEELFHSTVYSCFIATTKVI